MTDESPQARTPQSETPARVVRAPRPEAADGAAPNRAPRAGRAAQESGPAPGRILAAAASVSAGFGLMALMAGATQPEAPNIIVEVQPAPVVVESQTVQMPGTAPAPQLQVIRQVEPATPAAEPDPVPAPAPTTTERPVARSEGS